MENHFKTANEIRKTVLSMIYKAQVSHIGSNFSCIDILTVLYSHANFKTDRLVVSKGWVAASIYALNVKYGLMPQQAIDTFCDGESPYIGLIEPLGVFGAEIAGGSMGLGLPGAVGLALAKKLKGEEGTTYVLMSDGEMQCGTTWESALIAAHHKLDNLVVIVDYNKLQAMGKTNEILNINPLCNKWATFGWMVMEIDGHNFSQIEPNIKQQIGLDLLKQGLRVQDFDQKPWAIIADTVKGKGVSFMENNNLYHYKNLSEEEYH